METIKMIDKKWMIAVAAAVLMCIAGLSVLTAEEQDWDVNILKTGCCDKEVAAWTLLSGDYDQSAEAQDAAWETFKATHEGLEDSDRTGNRTYSYNCHGYTFGPGNVKIGTFGQFLGDTSGCWAVCPCGTVRADVGPPSHSCKVADNEGKCGSQFLCKNNQYVYEDVPIYQVYDKLP
ncbi:MAG: hypothetical protein JSU94_15940 [Phycisphaerales bacterium]|nr:MAG: hypothetical protein JSU94_15940 [Phycisphaerales bacterium]